MRLFVRFGSTLGRGKCGTLSSARAFSSGQMAVDPDVVQKMQCAKQWSDDEVKEAVAKGKLKFFNLENELGLDFERAVRIRREIVQESMDKEIERLPYKDFDYNSVLGQCCENVVGYVPVPVGVAGPILVDGKEHYLPMATTEGALIASTTRGCKALSMSGGVKTSILNDGMSRAPVLGAPSAAYAAKVKEFIEENSKAICDSFSTTTRFGRVKSIKTFVAGRKLYVRFTCTTGDAMGMNMVGKGVDKALEVLLENFPQLEILSLSGNVCTDKKPSAINWIEGRGKSLIAEAIVRKDIVEKVLKTNVRALCELNYSKNLLGSAVAGSIGGLNAHASNIVTAMFIATGQDPAQNVESSNCITIMEPQLNDDGSEDLYVSVTLPSLEVGTVGGGTNLPAQSSMLELLGVRGANKETPGENAKQLARIIASGVLAGELSLMSALSAGHLIKSHMALNRKPTSISK